MKKVAYAVYVSAIVVSLLCAKMGIISIDAIFVFFLVIILSFALFCFGGSAPLRQYPIDTIESLKIKQERKNEPFLIKPFFIICGPVILGFIFAYFM